MNKVFRKTFAIANVILLFLMCSIKSYGYGWGFKRNPDNRIPEVGFYENEINSTSSYYVGDTNQKIVYITFDAGYDNGILPKILDVLKEKNVKSTFFITGDFLMREQDLVKRMIQENHIIGNHTWNHKNITELSFEETSSELSKLENKYYEITGEKMVKYFRPPEGEFSNSSLKNVQKLGYKTFFWSIAYKDWDTNEQRSKEYGYNQIIGNLHNGAIILLHTVSKTNLECLGDVIDEIRNQGYTIRNLNEIRDV